MNNIQAITNEVGELVIQDSLIEEASLHGASICLPKIRRLLGAIKSNDSAMLFNYSHDTHFLLRLSWEKLHCGYWKEAAMCWREIYSLASLIEALCSEQPALAIRQLDLSLLMGSPHYADIAQRLISHLIARNGQITELVTGPDITANCCEPPPLKKSKVEQAVESLFPIPVITAPSLVSFMKNYMMPTLGRPVVIKGVVSTWPAVAKWGDLQYLKAVCGLRTVPVEVGSRYTSADWTQTLMTMNDFIDCFITHTKPKRPAHEGKVGYVAQTQLFEQITQLKGDIIIPDYTALHLNSDTEEKVSVHAWFGPSGTVSPIHHDPSHNLLCQVVGRKYVRLFSPIYQQELYPFEGRMMSNTSQVNAEQPDLTLYPLFSQVQYMDHVLEPGDILYIPPKWWHYLRSLDTSFSVSFWWQ